MATLATKTQLGELVGGGGATRPHVMFIPSAGMGHLLPFFRFIASLAGQHDGDVDISVVTVLPTVSAAEAEAEQAVGPVVVGDVDIPGVRRIPQSCLPQALLDLDKIFAKQFIANGRENVNADGFLVNTFEALEPAALAALRDGKVVPGFPPVYAIGPLRSQSQSQSQSQHSSNSAAAAAEVEKLQEDSSSSPVVAWLDKQPARSVVYVGFGNRSAATEAQNREIAAGLEASGCRFLWVLKTTKVDRDDSAELADVLGEAFMERLQRRQHGLVTKAWVDQEALLKHPAVGLYLSHSGWNSVTETAVAGVPLMAWPRGGDHRVNAMVAVSAGVGVWMEHWSWDGEDWLVTAEEIGNKVKEVMSDAAVRARATRISEEAAMAVAEGGTSYRSMHEFISRLKAAAKPT